MPFIRERERKREREEGEREKEKFAGLRKKGRTGKEK